MGTMGSARTALKRATSLLLFFTLATQVLGEPGVWSALSFLGGNAGKRSTDETQELYPMAEDMEMSSSYEEAEYEEYGEEAEARIEPFRRRRKPYRRRRKPKPPPSQDFYSGDYTERDSGYEPPQQGYDSPAFAESSPSYSVGGGKDSFNDFLNALAAFLPIGLFLAAIPPNLIVINSRRKREAEDTHEDEINSVETYPFLEKIDKIGLRNLQDSICQKELFCEMTVMGDSKNGNFVQKFLASVVKYTPDFLSDKIGVKDVFQASSTRSCEQFKCVKY